MSHEPFQNKNIKAFYGKCLVIIRSIKGQTDNIRLKAVSDGLTEESINLKSINQSRLNIILNYEIRK